MNQLTASYCEKHHTMMHAYQDMRTTQTVGGSQATMQVPVAQLVERWTPCGESTRPGYKSSGSRCDGRLIFMSILTGLVGVGGRPQLGEVGKGTGCVRLCAYKTLDSKSCHRTGIAWSRANATSSA